MKPANLLSLLLLVIILFDGYGQELKRNTLYLEAGGAAFYYSINYDKVYPVGLKGGIALRAGFMYVHTFNNVARRMYGIPVGISYLYMLKRNFLEFGLTGAGILDRYYSGSRAFDPVIEDRVIIQSVKFGIRHQPTTKRLFWNAAVQYSFLFIGDRRSPIQASHSLPLVSLGLGYSF